MQWRPGRRSGEGAADRVLRVDQTAWFWKGRPLGGCGACLKRTRGGDRHTTNGQPCARRASWPGGWCSHDCCAYAPAAGTHVCVKRSLPWKNGRFFKEKNFVSTLPLLGRGAQTPHVHGGACRGWGLGGPCPRLLVPPGSPHRAVRGGAGRTCRKQGQGGEGPAPASSEHQPHSERARAAASAGPSWEPREGPGRRAHSRGRRSPWGRW